MAAIRTLPLYPCAATGLPPSLHHFAVQLSYTLSCLNSLRVRCDGMKAKYLVCGIAATIQHAAPCHLGYCLDLHLTSAQSSIGQLVLGVLTA